MGRGTPETLLKNTPSPGAAIAGSMPIAYPKAK